MEPELETLQRDLARFDRHTRNLGLIGLAAAVIVAVLWIGAHQAQSQTASLSGRALFLVDEAGRQRIALGTDTSNRPGIWVRDESGKDRLWLGFAERGTPQISLSDETGRTRLVAGFSVDRGDPLLVLLDPAGTARAYFGFHAQLRTPQLVLDDEAGKGRIFTGWTSDGVPVLQVADESGNVVWKGGPGAATPGTASPGTGSSGGTSPGTNRKSGPPSSTP